MEGVFTEVPNCFYENPRTSRLVYFGLTFLFWKRAGWGLQEMLFDRRRLHVSKRSVGTGGVSSGMGSNPYPYCRFLIDDCWLWIDDGNMQILWKLVNRNFLKERVKEAGCLLHLSSIWNAIFNCGLLRVEVKNLLTFRWGGSLLIRCLLFWTVIDLYLPTLPMVGKTLV